MASPDNDPTNLKGVYSGYGDVTGVAIPSNRTNVDRSYTSVSTDMPGQHIHNTIGDPAGGEEVDAFRTIRDNDVYVDITPEEEA